MCHHFLVSRLDALPLPHSLLLYRPLLGLTLNQGHALCFLLHMQMKGLDVKCQSWVNKTGPHFP